MRRIGITIAGFLLLAAAAAAFIGKQIGSDTVSAALLRLRRAPKIAAREPEAKAPPVAPLADSYVGGEPRAAGSAGLSANPGAAAGPLAYSDRYRTCATEDTYDIGATTCYVDSRNGNDANDGLSEDRPVRSQAAINPLCTVVRFKRGSIFHEKLDIPKPWTPRGFNYKVKVYANYGSLSDPLPHFIVPSEPGRGPVVLSFFPLTIDGLHFSGARGDNTMEHDFDNDGDGITKGIVGGIGAFLGAATRFINNEIDNCDIGVMLGAPGSIVRGNYIHDLIMGIDEDPGVDPNLVGGAEGIFVNASNCEVSYNTFVNCTGPARWVGSNGTCDGGATEVSAASGGTIENVHIHHNYSNNSCGFFEVAAYFGDKGKGLFKNSTFHNNVIVDSAWMGLLQVNNINLENIHFYNNTLIQRPGSLNAGLLWVIFTSTSSGMQGGALMPGTVRLTNNLFVLHGVKPWSWPSNYGWPSNSMAASVLIDDAFVTQNNIVLSYPDINSPNYVDLGFANISGIAPSDFDLVNSDSPAVDTGADINANALDYFNRARPAGSAPDIGAMEYGSTQLECLPRYPAPSIRTRIGPTRPPVRRRGPSSRCNRECESLLGRGILNAGLKGR
ncbi:MAG: right-handed parallel beta-helix repeat-containing protein [Acidobacteriota bacterium]|nr:right-handed parallel beta-helix repeat-containing protein [Acidobacteriota bacterium]